MAIPIQNPTPLGRLYVPRDVVLSTRSTSLGMYSLPRGYTYSLSWLYVPRDVDLADRTRGVQRPDSMSDWLTRSPIELSVDTVHWTAKNDRPSSTKFDNQTRISQHWFYFYVWSRWTSISVSTQWFSKWVKSQTLCKILSPARKATIHLLLLVHFITARFLKKIKEKRPKKVNFRRVYHLQGEKWKHGIPLISFGRCPYKRCRQKSIK